MTVMSAQTRYAREKRAGSSVALRSVRQNRARAPCSFHSETQTEVKSLLFHTTSTSNVSIALFKKLVPRVVVICTTTLWEARAFMFQLGTRDIEHFLKNRVFSSCLQRERIINFPPVQLDT